VVDPKLIEHSLPAPLPQTFAGAKQFFKEYRTAFPDLTFKIEEAVAEGNWVAQRISAHGTMKAPFLGMSPTGKQATWSEMHMVRVDHGKIVEHWATVDTMGMSQQLGLTPSPRR
jgi:predicted ester cyclase